MVWRNQGFHPSTKSAGVASASSFPPPLFAAKSAPVHFLSRGFLISRVASLVSAAPTTTADDATANSAEALANARQEPLAETYFLLLLLLPIVLRGVGRLLGLAATHGRVETLPQAPARGWRLEPDGIR